MAITKRSDKGSALTYNEMDDNFDAVAPRTSETGSIQIPSGDTSERDGTAVDGFLRYNTSLNAFEGYQNGSWQGIGGVGSGDVNQNAFSTLSVSGQASISADIATDTIEFVAGNNVIITTNAASDSITISATGGGGGGISQDFAYSSLTGVPTTFPPSAHNQDWNTITNTPTTLSGYGITDGATGQQGIQGVEGSEGPPGPSGAQGTTGLGLAGNQGVQGIQGEVTGVVGPQGTDGSGAQGMQGMQGTIGQTGFGADGNQGVQGASGIQGAGGNAGDAGDIGNQGTQGTAGSVQGLQGADGIQGPDGSPGFGFQGIQGGGGQGVQGMQGDTGPAGFGLQGHQGVQGLDGPEGPEGAGAQGIQGMQGPQGTDGDIGDDGPSGAQGLQGPAGSVQGIQGITGVGDQGNQGIQGTSVQGLIGTTGNQGAQGIQGDLGFQGTQGLTGFGIQGTQGTTGLQGFQGVTLQGIQGLGNQGTQGAQGAAGGQGDEGIQGTQGIANQGAQGIQGLGSQGVQGPEGTFGQQGVQGQQSTQGIQGNSGTRGIQGPSDGVQGMQGTAGVGIQGPSDGQTGSQGLIGFQGIQGLSAQGTGGVQGDVGIQGPANGPQGTQGVQGAFGPQGLTGAGIQGTDGADGIQGPADGPQGTQGVIGTAVQGIQGSTDGPPGPQGTQGVQGLTGGTGLQGLIGLQGVQGLTGGTGLQGLQGLQGTDGFDGARTFTVTNSGSTDYIIDGSADPTIKLLRGFTYVFEVTATGHPFEIRVSNGGAQYNTGVTNNGAQSGSVLFSVPYNAPATLYYQCTLHSAMGGVIEISDVGPTGVQGLQGTDAVASLPLAGGTMTGNILHGDNIKATYGTGNDLEIYHDGSHSIITDVGTGNLYLRSNGNGILLQAATNEDSIVAVANGAVTLYHDNAAKLATTSTGIDVTGAVNSTGEMRISNPSATSQLYLYGAAGQKSNIILNEFGVRAWYVGAGTFTSGDFSISDGTTDFLSLDSSGQLSLTGTANPILDIPFTGADDTNSIRIQGSNGSSQRFAVDLVANGENARVEFKVGQTGNAPTTELMIHPDGGICFGTDTAAANALDDYEEGAFTPTIIFGTTNSGTTYDGLTTGSYTKIGNVVQVAGRVRLSSKGSGAGTVAIGGLPFAANQDGGLGITFIQNTGSYLFTKFLFLTIDITTTKAYARLLNSSGAFENVQEGSINSNFDIIFSGTYKTNS
jgi:hypothetical protein